MIDGGFGRRFFWRDLWVGAIEGRCANIVGLLGVVTSTINTPLGSNTPVNGFNAVPT